MFTGQDAHANFLIDRVNAIFESQEHVLNERLHQMFEYEKYFYTDDDLYEKLLEKYPNGSLPSESPAPVIPTTTDPASTSLESKKTKKSLGKKLRAPTLTLSRSGDDFDTMSISEEKASLNEDVEYSEAEMGSIHNGLEAHYQELFPFHRSICSF